MRRITSRVAWHDVPLYVHFDRLRDRLIDAQNLHIFQQLEFLDLSWMLTTQ